MNESNQQNVATPGILHVAAKRASSNLGTIVAGTLLFASGMMVENTSHFAHKRVEEAKLVRYVTQGYQLLGDPLYRNAEIALHVDHDKKQIYGVLRDKNRDIELRINEGLQTKLSFHDALYKKVQDDLESLGNGIDDLRNKMGEEGEKYWEQVKDRYEVLSSKMKKEVRELLD